MKHPADSPEGNRGDAQSRMISGMSARATAANAHSLVP